MSINFVKKFLLLLASVCVLGGIAQSAYAAEWDLLWSQNSTASIDHIAVDSTGVYLSGGVIISGYLHSYAEKRSASNGLLLWSVTGPSVYEIIYTDVAVDSTGVYLAGQTSNGAGSTYWRVEKRNLSNGSLIWGQSDLSPYLAIFYPFGLAVDGSGVYVSGWRWYGLGSYEWHVEKRSLSTGAFLWNQTAASNGVSYGLGVDGGGVYVLANTTVGCPLGPSYGGFCADWRFEKRSLTTGSLLWSVLAGLVLGDGPPGGGYPAPLGIALDNTGMYIAGADETAANNDIQWRMEKRSPVDGSLLWVKNTNYSIMNYAVYNDPVNGVSWVDIVRGPDITSSVAVNSTGAYFAGGEMPADYVYEGRVEKRNLSDGALLWSYPVVESAGFSDITVDSSGIYLVGCDTVGGSLIQKRVVATPPPSATLSVSPTTCTIAVNTSTCSPSFTWNITNAATPNLYNSTRTTQYSSLASGAGVAQAITNGINTIQARNGTTVLATVTATGSCATGTAWSGGICATINTAPTAPTISGLTTTNVNVAQTYSFVATDSEGDQIRYGVDWTEPADGVADVWVPAGATYVNSGISQSATHSWATAGTHTFKVLAQDAPGLNSAWATYTVTVPTPVTGTCGTSNGGTFASAPTTGLCSAGTASAVSGTGNPWTWSCTGSNGGTNAICNAYTNVVNGTCGTANGVSRTTAPTTNLCATGTASAVSGTGPWSWACSGSNGGTNISCSAPKTSSCGDGTCNGTETLVSCPVDCKTNYQQF